MEEDVVEGRKDSWLCEPGDEFEPGCRREGWSELGVARRPKVGVGGIEIGEDRR